MDFNPQIAIKINMNAIDRDRIPRKRRCTPSATSFSYKKLSPHKKTYSISSQQSREDSLRRCTVPPKKQCLYLFDSLRVFRSSTVSEPKLSSQSINAQYKAHFMQLFRNLSLIQTVDQVPPADLFLKMKNLPRFKKAVKTLVFDLDETLVHCVNSPDNAEPLRTLLGNTVYIKVRPYARECLRELNSFYEIIVFTASHREYADPVIDFLDPTGEIVQHRLYQDDCIANFEGTFIKDLRVINRDLENIIIVDNSVWSFAHQLDNGVPLLPWTGDPEDRELRRLVLYLKEIAPAGDVRDVNREMFKLHYVNIRSWHSN